VDRSGVSCAPVVNTPQRGRIGGLNGPDSYLQVVRRVRRAVDGYQPVPGVARVEDVLIALTARLKLPGAMSC
jgi:hypothetical protein